MLSPGNPGGKLGYRPAQYATNGRIGACDQLAPLKQNVDFLLKFTTFNLVSLRFNQRGLKGGGISGFGTRPLAGYFLFTGLLVP